MRLVKQLTKRGLERNWRATAGRQAQLQVQTGALPWRLADKHIEVLLVTGRRSGKWLIPKGWPMPGRSLAEAAAQEAFEEAGVLGTIDPKPAGSFTHCKQQLGFGAIQVSILVHRLWVDRELDEWPEAGQRKRKWFTVKEAARRVESCELKALILDAGRRSPAKNAPPR